MSIFVNFLTFICCAFILLLAVLIGIQLQREFNRLNVMLNELLSCLPNVGEIGSSQEEVVSNVEIICEKESEIQKAWSLYRRQWFSNDISQAMCGHDYASSTEAAEFFNPLAIFEHNRNWGMYRAMPSILTGLGILFTFVGLTIGIGGISGFEDQEGLSQLLGGASLAFCTSIVGLLSSLVFTYFVKQSEHQLQVRLSDLVCRMDWVFPIISTQKLNASNFAAVKENSQVALLLNEAIREFGDKSKEQAEALISSLVNEFSSQLKEEVRNLGDVFSKSLDKSVSQLEETVNNLATTLAKTTESRDQLNEELATLLKNYQKLGEKIDGLDTSLGKHTREYNELMDKTERILSQVSEDFKVLSGEQAKLLTTSTSVSKQFADTVDAMNASLKGYDASIKSAADMLVLSKDCIEHLNKDGIPALKEMEKNFQEISNQNQKTVVEFRQTAYELQCGAERLRGNMQATISSADTQLAGAIQILSRAVKDWGNYQNTTIESLAETIEDLKGLKGSK